MIIFTLAQHRLSHGIQSGFRTINICRHCFVWLNSFDYGLEFIDVVRQGKVMPKCIRSGTKTLKTFFRQTWTFIIFIYKGRNQKKGLNFGDLNCKIACFQDLFGEITSHLPLFSLTKSPLKSFKNISSLATSSRTTDTQ